MSALGSTWSRRRAAVAAEAAAEERALQDAANEAKQAALAEKTDEEILDELGLPDPDSLEMGDDFKAFMAKTVPGHLRKRALRKLWRSNPVLACVDGLNDYDDDYLTGSTGQGAIKTTYQVGKGMLTHLLEIERQRNAVVADDDEVDRSLDDEVVETAETVALTAPDALPVDCAAEVDDTPPMPAPRRMQFQFEDQSA